MPPAALCKEELFFLLPASLFCDRTRDPASQAMSIHAFSPLMVEIHVLLLNHLLPCIQTQKIQSYFLLIIIIEHYEDPLNYHSTHFQCQSSLPSHPIQHLNPSSTFHLQRRGSAPDQMGLCITHILLCSSLSAFLIHTYPFLAHSILINTQFPQLQVKSRLNSQLDSPEHPRGIA